MKFHPGPRMPPPPLSSRRKSPPGADTDRKVPAFEYVASRPSWPTAATPITPVNAAGYDGQSRPSLPAEARISDPAAPAALIAVRIVELAPGPPRLMLMIGAREGACTGIAFAPVAGRPAAYRMPCAMSKLVPSPVMPRTRIGRIFTFQF